MPISVCIPTYKSLDLIEETLATVFSQTYQDVEVVICNDSVDDHDALEKKLKAYAGRNIRFFKNEKNLGYPLNIRKCVALASHDTVFLLGQDDLILGREHFAEIVSVLEQHPEVGVITRPYFWFDTDPSHPIRQVSKCPQRFITVTDDVKILDYLLETLGQLSGLVYRKSLITHAFNEYVFPAHIYPFLSVMRRHSVYFWPDYTIAVRTLSSQTRFLSSIYRPSPTKTWVEMFQKVFPEPEFTKIRTFGIDKMARNYVGLAQIKNYGHLKDLLVDIYYLGRSRPKNLAEPAFWAFALGSLLIPRSLLRKCVDYYKGRVLKGRLGKANILETTPRVAGGES